MFARRSEIDENHDGNRNRKRDKEISKINIYCCGSENKGPRKGKIEGVFESKIRSAEFIAPSLSPLKIEPSILILSFT